MVIGRLPDLNLKLFCRGWLLSAFALLSLVDMSGLQAALAPGEAERLKKLDAYWSEVSRAVKEETSMATSNMPSRGRHGLRG